MAILHYENEGTGILADFSMISLEVRESAGWRCQDCGISQGSPVVVEADLPMAIQPLHTGGTVRLVTVTLDGDIDNWAGNNLRCCCMGCRKFYEPDKPKVEFIKKRKTGRKTEVVVSDQLQLFLLGDEMDLSGLDSEL